ncbi:MAG: hypothetical protein M1821_007451 [Bathelium mastoideum]|nr:MAG: hypothetical protein M1821_007451 [Bathelium mastoideum]
MNEYSQVSGGDCNSAQGLRGSRVAAIISRTQGFDNVNGANPYRYATIYLTTEEILHDIKSNNSIVSVNATEHDGVTDYKVVKIQHSEEDISIEDVTWIPIKTECQTKANVETKTETKTETETLTKTYNVTTTATITGPAAPGTQSPAFPPNYPETYFSIPQFSCVVWHHNNRFEIQGHRWDAGRLGKYGRGLKSWLSWCSRLDNWKSEYPNVAETHQPFEWRASGNMASRPEECINLTWGQIGAPYDPRCAVHKHGE